MARATGISRSAVSRIWQTASGQVIADITECHQAQEFPSLLNLINRSVPDDLDVQLVVNNVSTHQTPEIKRRLLRHQRFTLHFAPAFSSWINMAERWFAEPAKWLTRGTHGSTEEFQAAITQCGSMRGSERAHTWTRIPSPLSGTGVPMRSSRRSPATALGLLTQVTGSDSLRGSYFDGGAIEVHGELGTLMETPTFLTLTVAPTDATKGVASPVVRSENPRSTRENLDQEDRGSGVDKGVFRFLRGLTTP